MNEPDYRFTLANERTFLAWNRTSLALVAAGLAIAHVLPDGDPNPVQLAVGVAPVAAGGLLVVVSYRRWQGNDRAIRRDQPLPGSPPPLVMTVAIVVAGATAALVTVLT